MNAEDLTVTQQAITMAAGLFALLLLLGSLFVHAWTMIAWNRIMVWGGWIRDAVHDRIGLIDLLGCFVLIFVAQVVMAGIYYNESKNSAPPPPVRIESSEGAPKPAWLIPSANRQETQPTGLAQESANPEQPLESEGTDSSKKSTIPDVIDSPWFMLTATFSLVLGSIASAFWTLYRTRSTPRSLGLTSGKLFRDLAVGVLVFLWITPLVLMVNISVSQMTEIQYEHPVIESLKGRSWALPLLFTSAVIFAPLWEEYAFRFLLVNWLDTIRRNGLDLKRIMFGRPLSEPLATTKLAAESLVGSQTEIDQGAVQTVSDKFPPWWIAITSGILFGLAHFEYGVSWVPLVVLGTALARVYQLQRSILPCFLIHALFNSLAMVGFAYELFVKPAAS